MSVHRGISKSYDGRGRWLTETYAHLDQVGRGESYISGDEFTDGSIRMIAVSGNPNTRMETRVNGIFVLSSMRVNSSGGQKVVKVAGNYTQEIDDDVIILNGPATISLLKASTAFKQIKVKSNVSAGRVTVMPFAGDKVNNRAFVALGAGSSNTFIPIIAGEDWEIVS